MKLLKVQLQPNRSPTLDIDLMTTNLAQLSPHARVSGGEDDGPYINIMLETADLSKLWLGVQSQLQTSSSLANAAIVVCQGDQGWDDYLLLHHFDAEVKLDSLGDTA